MLDTGGNFLGGAENAERRNTSETDNSRGSVVHSYLRRKLCTSETNGGENRLVQSTEQI